MKCERCGGLLELVALPELRGRADGYELEVFGLRGLGCAEAGHPRRLLSPHFAADLLARLLHADALAAGRTQGLLRKRVVCDGCGAALAGAPREDGELRCRVRVGDTPPCTVTVRGPRVACPGCGQFQLPSADAAQAPLQAALLHGLNEAGVRS